MNQQFQDLKLKTSYRSDNDNIYCDFLEKCLKISKIYDRAVGYFTSDSLSLVLEGIEQLIKNNGKMRIVTSPMLSEKDIKALKQVNDIDIINFKIEDEIKKFYLTKSSDITKLFSWLISKEILEIKIAYQKNLTGIYHEKFGIFKDFNENYIAFSGSVNETIGGISKNFESIDIYASFWGQTDIERIEGKKKDFENLWNNKTNKIEVIELSEAIKNDILAKVPSDEEIEKIIKKIEKNSKNRCLKRPEWLNIREYQEIALKSWIENKYQGILEMATGSGKTITALNIMYEISKTKKIFFIIVCPQTYLVNQWYEELLEFGIKGIICSSENKVWKDELNLKKDALNYELSNVGVAIVTNKTLQNKSFLRAIKRLKKSIMIIVDECHNIGSQSFKEFLEKEELLKIKMRLGLSATPERQGDEKGNKIIENYLGKVIFKFSLEEAIHGNFLTNYKYYPRLIVLKEEEEKEYIELSKKIAALSYIKDTEDMITEKKSGSMLEMLLFKRARILNLTSNKIDKLLEDLDERSFNNLIYVGAGKNKIEDESNEINFIDETIKRIRENLNFKVMKFTSKETKDERVDIIDKFEKQDINAVIAIKCLDEGVNIPSIERAYILGSTGNYREFVQRRGRILRKSQNKIKAEIFDYLVVPRSYYYNNPKNLETFSFEKKLVENELKRLEEYNNLALNKARNESMLANLKKYYGIKERS